VRPTPTTGLGRRDAVAAVALGAAFLVLGVVLARVFAVVVDPDSVAYTQLARHYLAGRTDLAITTWWGPLLSWALVPALALGLEPQFAARLLNAVAAVALAAAMGTLSLRLAGAAAARWAFVLTLAASVHMLVDSVTPDLLLAAAVGWYLVASHAYLSRPSAGRAAWAGAVGGAAYLVKAYAFPFAVANTVLLLLTVVLGGTRGRRAGVHAAAALAALLAVATPWIAAMALTTGQLTLGSAGAYAASFARLERHPTDRDLKPMFDLTTVETGRVTSWEAPIEPVPRTPPPIAGQPLLDRAFDLLANVDAAIGGFHAIDGVGLLLSLLLVATALALVPGAHFAARDRAALRWLALATLVYVGGYLLFLVEARYLWPAVAAAIAVAVASLHVWGRSDQHRAGGAVHVVLAVVLATTLAWGARATLAALVDDARDQARVDLEVGRALAAVVVSDGPPRVAGNDWLRALRVAYWADGQLLGRSTMRDADGFAADLAGYVPDAVVLHGAADLAAELVARGDFIVAMEVADVVVLTTGAARSGR
jgi:hypothetical protein